jgi:hypothetical protein
LYFKCSSDGAIKRPIISTSASKCCIHILPTCPRQPQIFAERPRRDLPDHLLLIDRYDRKSAQSPRSR